MRIELTCRSPQDIADDTMLETLAWAQETLKATGPLGYVFVGTQRRRLKALVEQIERAILEGETLEPTDVNRACLGVLIAKGA